MKQRFDAYDPEKPLPYDQGPAPETQEPAAAESPFANLLATSSAQRAPTMPAAGTTPTAALPKQAQQATPNYLEMFGVAPASGNRDASFNAAEPEDAPEQEEAHLVAAGATEGDPNHDDRLGSGFDYESQSDALWKQNLKDFEGGLQGQLDQTYADEARAGRIADSQAGELGRSLSGGGYAAGQAQVQLGGMAQRQDTRNKHVQQGLQMKMAYLDTLIKRAEASKDRNLQEKLQAEADKTMLAINGAGIDKTDYAGLEEGEDPVTAEEILGAREQLVPDKKGKSWWD